MASREITEAVKAKLLADWLPDKPGGLKGLVAMAADAALAVVAERVEFLDDNLIVAYMPPDAKPDPTPAGDIDQTKYLCPQCGVTHQRASAVGTRHAHRFYGGTAELVHLENCPKLEDPEYGVCNCNASNTAADRAIGRREPSL